jgi:hypothetical protein
MSDDQTKNLSLESSSNHMLNLQPRNWFNINVYIDTAHVTIFGGILQSMM